MSKYTSSQHHEKTSSYFIYPTTDDDQPSRPPPLPPCSDVETLPAVKSSTSLSPHVYLLIAAICVVLVLFIIFIFAGIPIIMTIYESLSTYSPNPQVASAFVAVTRNNNTNGTSNRLTAHWAVNLRLDNSDVYSAVLVYRVETSVSHVENDSSPDQVLASSAQFARLSNDGRHITLAINLGTDDVVEGPVADAISREMEINKDGPRGLRFRASILVWVRTTPYFYPYRYYLARISCDPFWITSSNTGGCSHGDHKDCQFHVDRQSKSEANWTDSPNNEIYD